MEAEYKIISDLTGAKRAEIRLHDDGFMSRGYVINDGDIVFKFRRTLEVDYAAEARLLEYVNSLDLGVNLPRVGWESETGDYLGLYGVPGASLEEQKYKPRVVGKQLGNVLKKLHSAKPVQMEKTPLKIEIAAWQKRYNDARGLMQNYFDAAEMDRLDWIMTQEMPVDLQSLGEKLVLSHGDLGDGNVLVDQHGKVGVIDWGEITYLDEAADFMDLSSDELTEALLKTYGADEKLRQKVKIRRMIRPIFVFGSYVRRNSATAPRMMKLVRERALEQSW